MDISRAGHWLDVNNEGSYPFVCSRYKAKCPSVAKFFNNSASMFYSNLSYQVSFLLAVIFSISCMIPINDIDNIRISSAKV